MSATAPTSPVVAAAGRELALLAFVCQELRRVKLAGQLAHSSVDALRGFRQERVSQIYQTLFGHFELQGDWRAARLVARAVLRRAPDSAAAHQQLGSVALRQGDVDEAFAQLRRAVALGAQSPLLLRQLADLYLARDSTAEAILALRAAGGDQTPIGDQRHYQDQADQIVAQARAHRCASAAARRPPAR